MTAPEERLAPRSGESGTGLCSSAWGVNTSGFRAQKAGFGEIKSWALREVTKVMCKGGGRGRPASQ